MMNAAALAKVTREAAQQRLGRDFVRDIQVSDYVDAFGDKAFEVLVIVDKFDPDILSFQTRFEITRSLIDALTRAGDERHPFIKFIPKDELADAAANDD